MSSPSGTELEVCKDIADRQQRGLYKYGVSVEFNPLSLQEWLQHTYEETLDKAIYLKRAMGSMWQPMDSAPRDGSCILAVMAGQVVIAYWDRDQFKINPKPYWKAYQQTARGWSRNNQPTAWQPLPLAPKLNTETNNEQSTQWP